MSNNTRKIVVLDRLDSPCIEQAIFILRDDAEIKEWDALSEAQKIVNNYLYALPSQANNATVKKKKRTHFIIGMALYTFSTMILTAYLLAMIK